MSSDAVAEINLASFRPAFISAGLGELIGKTNVTINEKGERKRGEKEREREREREGRGNKATE